MERYAKPQLLFLQIIMLKVDDSAYAWYILRMQTAGLCHTVTIYSPLLSIRFIVSPLRNLPVKNDRKLGGFKV